MKKGEKKTRVKPRVTSPYLKKGGVHGKSRKAQRKKDKQTNLGNE